MREVIFMPSQTAWFTIGNLKGSHDAGLLKKKLDELPGVTSVSINESLSRLAVDYDSTGVKPEKIANRIRELGYEAIGDSGQNQIM
jgi:copper chaperone CopZ